MARSQHAGPSTLRNRNRVTNKTRLKIIKESIDADPIVLDEDEEKARVISTAGVDAEDANVSLLALFRRCGRRCWGRLRGLL
jgi:enhancer of polycomb-like protein